MTQQASHSDLRITQYAPMIRSYCPVCGCYSGEMGVSEHRNEPTPAQLASRPDFAPIAHEILLCPCGEPLTWFDMEERADGQ